MKRVDPNTAEFMFQQIPPIVRARICFVSIRRAPKWLRWLDDLGVYSLERWIVLGQRIYHRDGIHFEDLSEAKQLLWLNLNKRRLRPALRAAQRWYTFERIVRLGVSITAFLGLLALLLFALEPLWRWLRWSF